MSKQRRLLKWAIIFAVGLVLAIVILVFVHRCAVLVNNRTLRHENLTFIDLALINYRDTFGEYPPVSKEDSSVSQLHSWRVLIMPYLVDEYDMTKDGYSFDKSWNALSNLHAAQKGTYEDPNFSPPKERPLSACYKVPLSQTEEEITDYVAVIAPKLLNPKRYEMVGVISIPNLDIHWTEPRDLTCDEAIRILSSMPKSNLVDDVIGMEFRLRDSLNNGEEVLKWLRWLHKEQAVDSSR